jgi:hypothetical protein
MPSPPDIDRLIAEVAARHGILLKRDDAAFALVTINQLVLEQALSEIGESIRGVVAEFENAVIRQHSRVGGIIGQEIKRAIAELRAEAPTRAVPASAHRRSHSWFWVALSQAGIFGAGFVAGMLLK